MGARSVAKSRPAYREITKLILGVAAGAGVVAVAAVCPNLLQLVPGLYRKKYRGDSIRKTFFRLDERGWIVLRKTSKGWQVSLTQRGHSEWAKYELGEKKIHASEKWDGRWRLLMFDIPEKRKAVRDRVRSALLSLGFVRLQDSAWIFPYECKEVLELLRTKYHVRYEALYLTMDRFENDRWLVEGFKLKKNS